MEVVTVLHMNKGAGETSYAKNSIVQSKIISKAKPYVEKAIMEIMCADVPESLGFAELGCSSGPNSLSVVSEVIDLVHATCSDRRHPSPEIRVYLNDLPSNDFNTIFRSLPGFYSKLKVDQGSMFGPCFISAVPGSFYGRLFPSRSLHFLHSSSSLHWLSQVPRGLDKKVGPGDQATALMTIENRGAMYISKNSPKEVAEAYASQFKEDFGVFLASRSEEMVCGGRMVLSLMGRSETDDPTTESALLWEFLSRAIASMVCKGLIEEAQLDSFNAPYYAPSTGELRREIKREGSFTIDQLETFETSWDYLGEEQGGGGGGKEIEECRGERVAKMMRAVVESMLESHFGGEIPMDEVFRRVAKLIDDHLSNNRSNNVLVVISLVRRERKTEGCHELEGVKW